MHRALLLILTLLASVPVPSVGAQVASSGATVVARVKSESLRTTRVTLVGFPSRARLFVVGLAEYPNQPSLLPDEPAACSPPPRRRSELLPDTGSFVVEKLRAAPHDFIVRTGKEVRVVMLFIRRGEQYRIDFSRQQVIVCSA